MIEKAIIKGGVDAKNNLIRSSRPINTIHDAVKSAFIKNKVNANLIHPPLGKSSGEIKLAGFFNEKDQDICIFPKHIPKRKETLNFEGLLNGESDEYGIEFTEKTLSVNVRSQLSSISKNFDTLYERTLAEALNLHIRCERMVLGELYMIPVYEYDDEKAKSKKIAFKKNNNIQGHIEKYLHSFSAINNRTCLQGEEYKYERVCLLIVDFENNPPVIYNTDNELKKANLLPQGSNASINDMNFSSFVSSLKSIYEKRFGQKRFI
ncbi:MAG: hypothetical protein ACTTJD_06590 [Porphyromonadaceae bacterium]